MQNGQEKLASLVCNRFCLCPRVKKRKLVPRSMQVSVPPFLPRLEHTALKWTRFNNIHVAMEGSRARHTTLIPCQHACLKFFGSCQLESEDKCHLSHDRRKPLALQTMNTPWSMEECHHCNHSFCFFPTAQRKHFPSRPDQTNWLTNHIASIPANSQVLDPQTNPQHCPKGHSHVHHLGSPSLTQSLTQPLTRATT